MLSGLHKNHSTTHSQRTECQAGLRSARIGLKGGRYRRYSLAERLAARTVKGPSCWEVQGYQNPHNGYVLLCESVGDRKRFVKAHRLAYELAYGPIPEGLVVMHTCDNPRCVNPAHLKADTQAANIHDALHKGRYNAFGRQKLNADRVREIRALWARGMRQRDIAAKFGIRRHSVSGIVHNKSWQHVGPFDPVGAVLERVPCVYLPIRGEVA